MSKWLVTGVAGFVGSNILEELLKQNQIVIGLDNLSTGKQYNLDQVKQSVSKEQWSNFSFKLGDIRNVNDCQTAVEGADYVVHQAALIAVQDSITNPTQYVDVNINGFINVLESAKQAKVKKFVYASSCAVENPISTYGISKAVNEMYANIQTKINCVGLRYYNIYGPRQDINSPYAAVIPKWVSLMIKNKPVTIYGTGETTRDFIHVKDIANSNILAALNDSKGVIKLGTTIPTSLTQLFHLIKNISGSNSVAVNEPFRSGDILHSCATTPVPYSISLEQGLTDLIQWYKENETKNTSN